jgi:hypothetical protein
VSMVSTSELATIPIATQTIRKVRIRILPFLFVLYVICYLDRVNIGIAALTMNQDLAITSEQFGLLTGIFFIGYFLFEVPRCVATFTVRGRLPATCTLRSPRANIPAHDSSSTPVSGSDTGPDICKKLELDWLQQRL